MTDTKSTDNVAGTNVIGIKPLYVYVALLVLLLVMATGFYLTWRQLLLRDQQFREFQQQSENAERLQDKFLQQNTERQQALQSLLEEQLTQFDVRIEKLNNSDRSDWLLAETEYLLRMANQYATLARDPVLAESLLGNADQVMKELEKSIAVSKNVVGIRKKIAEERAALKLHSEFDKEGLYLQLEALIKQVEKTAVVDIASASKQNQADNKETITDPELSISSRMTDSLLHSLEKIGGYIRIQEHDEEIGPLLSPNEQQYLKQNLRMALEQAQTALLQQNQLIYETSLEDAKQWIQKYYVIDPALKNKWLAELEVCRRENIADPLPDISGSLEALKNFMLTRHVLHEKSSQP